MSGVTATSEFAELGAVFGYDLDDLEALTVTAADAAFIDDDRGARRPRRPDRARVRGPAAVTAPRAGAAGR
jgi:hypothetical protein